MLRLTFDDQGTRHGDLRLACGDYARHVDSYYFSLDPAVRSRPESERVRASVELLLDQWMQLIQSAKSGQTVYLLFELADEYTGWLRVTVEGDRVRVRPGWSSVPGHKVYPSQAAAQAHSITDFDPIPDAEDLVTSQVSLYESVELNRTDVVDLHPPPIDPTAIFELFRGSYGTELLTAAVAHFDLFTKLSSGPKTFETLRAELDLAPRPMNVLVTALRAMRLLRLDEEGRLQLTSLSRQHLPSGSSYDVGGYIGLAASSPGVVEMVERLRSNTPRGLDLNEDGTAFIYQAGVPSAMEQTALARHFTLSLAGRAKNVAPALAQQVDLGDAQLLLDVGGGSGIYSIALLKRYSQLRAVVIDRPEVLRVADEYRRRYNVADRLELREGDMFGDPLPTGADVVLLSNVLHDWDVAECRQLIARACAALKPGGQILIHDVFLNDDLDGPLPIALYSAALFTLTLGRAYSAAEYRRWLTDAGFIIEDSQLRPTLIHCGVLSAKKSDSQPGIEWTGNGPATGVC
jgi:SAM-dependent methyltransferase